MLLAGCAPSPIDYFAEAVDPDNREATELLQLIEPLLVQEPTSAASADPVTGAQRAVAVERLAGFMVRAGHADRMVVMLAIIAGRDPNDPYGAYYYYLLGRHYQEAGSLALARYYYGRVVGDYEDLQMHGVSLHVRALSALIDSTHDPYQRAGYYRQLIGEHADAIDLGRSYYYLGVALEELGEWEQAYAAYRSFVRYPGTHIPGKPRAYEETVAKLEFYDSDKSWVVSRLEDLRNRITWAIVTKNGPELTRYQARVGFFTRSWEQENTDPNATPEWNIGSLLERSHYVSVAEEVDLASNADEAYLYTNGWGERIRTWYLYFRRIDFPADPEIHNSWEWAGVFLGERL